MSICDTGVISAAVPVKKHPIKFDISSGLIASLIKPKTDNIILDVCAAPGGKACGIAEKMKNRQKS